MGKEKNMLCLSVRVDGEEAEKVARIHSRLSGREKPKRPRGGSIHDRENGVWSRTVGGERGLLKRISEENVSGTLLGVDGLTKKVVNISILVSDEELKRLEGQPEGFTIECVHRLT